MTDINGFVAEWLSHRKVLHQMLEEVKTEQLNLKPWEGAMSLSELVQHIAGAMAMFVRTVKNGVFTPGESAKAPETIEELKAAVASATEQTEAALRSLGSEELERTVDFFGNASTGSALLQNAKDHEIHHKGQLFVYLRLAGIEKVPFFVSRG